MYFEDIRAMIHRTPRNDSLPPLKRLRALVDAEIEYLNRIGWQYGCFVGNFSAEANEDSEIIRTRVIEIFEEMRQSVAYCLRATMKIGELLAKP